MRTEQRTVGGCGGWTRSRSGGPSAGRLSAWIVGGLLFVSLVASRPVFAQDVAGPTFGPAQPQLLLRGAEGEPAEAPLLEIDFVLSVTGLIARGTVTQRFINPSDRWLEGIYRFPLPEHAAVDGLRMRIGDRVVEGEIQEKEEARQTYQRARDAGQRASLVEQQRPDLFTTRVANVGPGAEIEIELDFQWALAFDESGFAMRLPWIIAPRFGDGEDDDAVAAGAPPPGTPPSQPDVAFAIDLDPGFPLAWIESPTHPLHFEQRDLNRLVVTLAAGSAPADRDFVLRWRPTPGDEPRAALFRENRDGQEYLMMMVLPPDSETAADPGSSAYADRGREIVFVIDTSGSMGGASIEQARQALTLALGRLENQDRFNLIAFDSETTVLFPDPVPADPGNVEKATAWVRALEADGGTVMMPALAEALRDPRGGSDLRQIVFVTDGCIGNEQALFTFIQEHLGRSRLFTVGIGSAPNGHFMEGAARFGRGSHTFIASPDEVQARMGALFAKLERPALTDVEVRWNDAVEMWPERIPDLYHGEPILLTARLDRFVGGVVLAGELDGLPWETRLALQPGRPERGVEKLFGREKVAALMDRLIAGEPLEAVQTAVTEVALEHGLVSRWTSLVAVDRTPVRPRHEDLADGTVAAGMPAHFMLPATATSASLLLLHAIAALLLSALLFRTTRDWRA